MKKSFYILVAASTAVMLLASCAKEVESVPADDNNGPVYITASIDPETKSTLNDGTGAFAFSNGDAIKVCNESGAFSGTTESTANSGTFAMAAGFNGSTDGIAGFPASIVSAMTSSSVTFVLPASYDYAAVGGTDASAAKVPCPMIGSYNGTTKKVTLKQAGSVVRFKVTNIKAGTLSFVFASNVTGQAIVSSIPSGEGGGITSLTTPGNIITINDVPTVTSGSYVYITIPVPTGTVPNNILVTNEPSDASVSRFQSLTREPVPTALSRAGGYKWSLSPTDVLVQAFTINAENDKVVLAPGNLMAHISDYNAGVATADEWRFEPYFEYIKGTEDTGNYLFAHSNGDCVGKWVDSFRWQGASVTEESGKRVRGLCNFAYDAAYNGDVNGESLYPNCWNTDVNNANPATNGGIYISNGGSYTWRMLTSDEWDYILSKRPTSTLNEVENARCARANANGVNGLLIFPDNIGYTWNVETMGSYPNDINRTTYYYDGEGNKQQRGQTGYYGKAGSDPVSTYTADQMTAMINVGVVFLPCAGFIAVNTVNSTGKYGYYWTSTSNSDISAWYVNFNENELTPVGGYHRRVGRSVRLARDI